MMGEKTNAVIIVHSILKGRSLTLPDLDIQDCVDKNGFAQHSRAKRMIPYTHSGNQAEDSCKCLA